MMKQLKNFFLVFFFGVNFALPKEVEFKLMEQKIKSLAAQIKSLDRQIKNLKKKNKILLDKINQIKKELRKKKEVFKQIQLTNYLKDGRTLLVKIQTKEEEKKRKEEALIAEARRIVDWLRNYLREQLQEAKPEKGKLVEFYQALSFLARKKEYYQQYLKEEVLDYSLPGKLKRLVEAGQFNPEKHLPWLQQEVNTAQQVLTRIEEKIVSLGIEEQILAQKAKLVAGIIDFYQEAVGEIETPFGHELEEIRRHYQFERKNILLNQHRIEKEIEKWHQRKEKVAEILSFLQRLAEGKNEF
jgi:hypothetical protein